LVRLEADFLKGPVFVYQQVSSGLILISCNRDHFWLADQTRDHPGLIILIDAEPAKEVLR
jgi:hypothetical protein